MREVTGEPEELQLKRQRERVERRTRRSARRDLVEELQEARERSERTRVRLLLRKEAQRRLDPYESDREPVRIFPRLPVRVDQLGARDRL